MAKSKRINIPLGFDLTEMEKSHKELQKQTRKINTELNKVNRQLKYDPKNEELRAQKLELIAEKEKKVQKELDSSMKLQKAFGEATKKGMKGSADEYRKYIVESSKATKQLELLNKQKEEMNKPMSVAKADLQKVNELLKFDGTNKSLLNQKENLLKKNIKESKDELRLLKNELSNADRLYREGKMSKDAYHEFRLGVAKAEGSLKGLKGELERTRESGDKFIHNSKNWGTSLEKVGGDLKRTGDFLLRNVITPMTALAGVSINIGSDFSAELSNVQAISGSTYAEMDKLEDKARELGAQTKYSAKNVTEGMKFTSLAGWDVQETIDGIEGILNLTAGADGDMGEIADIMTDTMSAFNVSADESERFADVMAQTSASSNTSIEQMGETLKYTASLASALDFSIEDLSLAIGLMADSGVKASNSGTALRSAMLRMASPPKEAGEVMEKFGLTLDDGMGGTKEFIDVLRDLRKTFGGMTEIEQASYGKDLFGTEAVTGMLGIINASSESFDKLADRIENSSGKAKEMATVMQDNLKGEFTALKSSMEELGIKAFRGMEKNLRNILKNIQKLIDYFNNLSPRMKRLLITIGKIIAVLTSLLIIFGTITAGIGAFLLLVNPITIKLALISGAITGIIGVTTLLLTKGKEVVDSNKKYKESLEDLVDSHKNEITAITDKAKKREDEINSVNKTIHENRNLVGTYEELMKKSQLSKEELGRYISVVKELERTTNTANAEKLKNELDDLKARSGLSNEELGKLVDTNDLLVDKFEGTATKVDDFGTRVIDNIEKVREASRQLEEENIRRIATELKIDSIDTEDMMAELQDKFQDRSVLEFKVKTDSASIKAIDEQIKNDTEQIDVFKEKLEEVQETLKNKFKLPMDKETKKILEAEEVVLQNNVKATEQAMKNREKEKKNLEELVETNKVALESLDEIFKKGDEHFKQTEKNLVKFTETIKIAFGVELDSGSEIEQLDALIKKKQEELEINKQSKDVTKEQVESQRRNIEMLADVKERFKEIRVNIGETTKEYDGMKDNTLIVKENIRQYLENLGDNQEIKNFNENLSEEIIKNLIFAPSESKEELDRKFGEEVTKGLKIVPNIDFKKMKKEVESDIWTKRIDFELKVSDLSDLTAEQADSILKQDKKKKSWWGKILGYAKGTNNHSGGKAFLGEEGTELVTVGSKQFLADFGLYDLPSGAKVETHAETMKLLRNNLAMSMDLGKQSLVQPTGVLSSQNKINVENNSKILSTPVQLDGKVIAEIVHKEIQLKERLGRN